MILTCSHFNLLSGAELLHLKCKISPAVAVVKRTGALELSSCLHTQTCTYGSSMESLLSNWSRGRRGIAMTTLLALPLHRLLLSPAHYYMFLERLLWDNVSKSVISYLLHWCYCHCAALLFIFSVVLLSFNLSWCTDHVNNSRISVWISPFASLFTGLRKLYKWYRNRHDSCACRNFALQKSFLYKGKKLWGKK